MKFKTMTAVALISIALFSTACTTPTDTPTETPSQYETTPEADTTPTETPEADLFLNTIETASSTALQMLEELNVPGATIAFVDATTGFTWTQAFGLTDSESGALADEHTLF